MRARCVAPCHKGAIPMPFSHNPTRQFPLVRDELRAAAIRRSFQLAYEALREKGYQPIDQIVGYLMSGDPTYITSHRGARSAMRQIPRDELIEELVRCYLADSLSQKEQGQERK